MRRLLFLLFILFAVAGDASAAADSVRVLRRTPITTAGSQRTLHVEPWIAINPRDAKNLIATCMIGDSSVIYQSRDAGATWRQATPGLFGGGDPHVVFDGNGTAFFSTVSPFRVWKSRDGGATWTRAGEVPGGSYDRQFLATGRARDGTPLVVAAAKMPLAILGQETTHVIAMWRSTDAAATFPLLRLFLPPPDKQFVQIVNDMAITREGQIIVVYSTFDRAWIEELVVQGDLWVIVFDATLRPLSEPRHVTQVLAYGHGDEFKSVKGLGGGRLAIDERLPGSPRLYVTWLDLVDRSYQVFVSRSDNLGASWNDPVQVNDAGTATDQSNPGVAVDGSGTVGIVWNDRRNDAEGWCFEPYFAASLDGGATFLPNVPLIARPTCPAGRRANNAVNIADAQIRFLNGGDTHGIAGTSRGFEIATIAATADGALHMWSVAVNIDIDK